MVIWLPEYPFIYLRIESLKIKVIDIQKVKKFIELQERVNREIDTYGQASWTNVEMLEEIGDSLSHEEIEKVTELINN